MDPLPGFGDFDDLVAPPERHHLDPEEIVEFLPLEIRVFRLLDQDPEAIGELLGPKVVGAWALHELTSEMSLELFGYPSPIFTAP